MTPPAVERVTLAPGYTIAPLIKGGWQLAGGHGVVEHDAALLDMAAFVDAGLTTFDCADIYTGVESLIGDFLGTVPPGTVQVHTKCVPDLDRLPDLTPSDIDATVLRSCNRLGVDAIDLVQFHWWDYARGDYVAAARHLATLQRHGVIRHLGLTNFGVQPLTAVLDAGVPVVAHQVQYSLLDRRPAVSGMASLCAERGVGLLCYGALAGGFFHERWIGAPDPGEGLENRSLVKYRLVIDECGGWVRFQQLLHLLSVIGERHGTGIGAVAIRWVLDQPGVRAVIAGARHARHLPDTLAALRITLGAEDRRILEDWLSATPGPPGDVYALERDRTGRHGRIMRYNLSAG